jgi:hypothetical protein
MQPVQTPITGREDPGDLASLLQALAQFYAAFNRRDLHAMSRNWLPAIAAAVRQRLTRLPISVSCKLSVRKRAETRPMRRKT